MKKIGSRFNKMLLGASVAMSAAIMANAAAAQDLGSRAESLTEQFNAVATMMPIIGVIAGFVFLIVAFVKLAKHNQDPRENSMKAVVLYGAAGICLLFMGAFAAFGGTTIFGANANDGGDAGLGTFNLN